MELSGATIMRQGFRNVCNHDIPKRAYDSVIVRTYKRINTARALSFSLFIFDFHIRPPTSSNLMAAFSPLLNLPLRARYLEGMSAAVNLHPNLLGFLAINENTGNLLANNCSSYNSK